VDLGGAAGDDGETGEGDTVGADFEGILGGSGNDVLTGGPGDDLLDGGPGADQMNGGGGDDVVDYSLRTAAVTADADGVAGDDGEAGEGDSIAADVEDLVGGDGNDSLTGNSSANYIWGGPGNDVLDGGGGVDWFFADDGDDTIAMRDDLFERAFCGDGEDSVTADDADDTDPDCETVARTTPTAKPPKTGTTTTPIPPRTPPRTSTPPAVVAPVDLTAPKATLVPVVLPVKRAVARGIRFKVTCDEDCSTEISLVLSVKQLKQLGFAHAKRPLVVARGERTDTDAKSYVVVVRFTAKMRKQLAKARSLRLEVRAVFSDFFDNKIRRRPSILKLSR
jgi:hypothetical protein